MNKYAGESFAKAFYDRAVPPLHYRHGMSIQEREEWKHKIRKKIIELMAFPDTMYETPIVNPLIRKDRGSYFIEKYEISPEPDLWMTFLLLIPKTASEENKTPAVLCTPGTLGTKEILAGEDFQDLQYDPPQQRGGFSRYHFSNAMALHYVNHGFTALACEDIGVGEHHGDMAVEDLEKLLIGQGRSMMGVTVELRLAMIKWLKERPFVDRERIAVSGHSLGVDSAMHVAILDEDIKAFVYNDFICDWKERISVMCPPDRVPTASWHMFSGMWRWYTYPDLLAAYAPRKLFITEGGRTKYLEELAQAYKESGAPENFRYDYYREYSDPANRHHDHDELPMGMTGEQYFEYSNVIPPKHFFKFETAIPWLTEALK